jgi:hypothetical protein
VLRCHKHNGATDALTPRPSTVSLGTTFARPGDPCSCHAGLQGAPWIRHSVTKRALHPVPDNSTSRVIRHGLPQLRVRAPRKPMLNSSDRRSKTGRRPAISPHDIPSLDCGQISRITSAHAMADGSAFSCWSRRSGVGRCRWEWITFKDAAFQQLYKDGNFETHACRSV